MTEKQRTALNIARGKLEQALQEYDAIICELLQYSKTERKKK